MTRLESRDPSRRLGLPEAVRAELERLVRARQREWRAPAVVAALSRDGGHVWGSALGLAEVATSLAADRSHQFQIASLTKTFTAVAALQLVVEGQLELETPAHEILPGHPTRPALTIRRLLSHASGLQREPAGIRWDVVAFDDEDALLARLPESELVMPPGERWHYSNLAFAVVGAVVARLCGTPFVDVLRERVLEPAGLRRTGFVPEPPRAHGYNVMPFTDVAHEEPVPALGGWAAAGGLWSTADDLGTWSDVLAGARPDILDPVAAERMHLPQVVFDPDRLTLAYGLGLMLVRRGERVYAGHGGSMPGFRTALFLHRGTRIGATVLTNTGTADPEGLAADLLDRVVDLAAEETAWLPGDDPPPEVDELLGIWWSEGSPFTVRVRDGRLEIAGDFAGPPARLEPIGVDRYRVVEGRERGEVLEVVRSPDGGVSSLVWATYPLVRVPPKRTVGPDVA